ncbi:unnamed protein product, partial [Discosporangium mesarthrocarpum]
AEEALAALPPGAVNRRRRVSVSAEVDASKAPRVKKVIPKTDSQLKDIDAAICGCFLFTSLPEDQYKEVVDSMEEQRFNPGDVVIKEGDEGEYFYVTGSGKLEVFIVGKNEGNAVRTLGPGDSFGELALMYNSPRTATAVTECLLWALDRTTFRHTILEAGQARRKKYEGFLSKVAVLEKANLSTGELALLADAVEPTSFKDGEVIIRQGDHCRKNFKFYIVEEGQVTAHVEEGGEEILMSNLVPGDYFGEKALVEKTPRTATVRATGPAKCAALSIAAFERLMGPCEDILKERMSDYHSPADVKSGRVSPRGLQSP